MSHETISVRMNRSDGSIRWGFTLGRRGNEIIVATVEKDSLSEKAGLKAGDEVVSVLNRTPIDIHDAQRTADTARLEITFNLKRFVTSHTCLPWTLTEKDNKLFVEEIPTGLSTQRTFANNNFSSSGNQWNRSGLPMTGYSSESRQNNYNYSSTGGGERNIPIQHSPFSSGVNHQSLFESQETRNNYEPGRVFHSPSSYTTSMKNSGWNRERQAELTSGPGRNESSSYNYSYSGTGPAANYGHQGNTNNYNNTATGFGMSNGHVGGARPPQTYSYNNGATAKPFGVGSGGTPLNQQTFINTSSSPIPPGYHSSVSPGGTKMFYHSPSPRTRAQLSPNASVHHLQYNSPMNLYSSETCAEQYTQQTGLPVDTPPGNSKTPAYLTSATKKLIEEGEAIRRPTTPSQSSSFKRISEAVGEPVH